MIPRLSTASKLAIAAIATSILSTPVAADYCDCYCGNVYVGQVWPCTDAACFNRYRYLAVCTNTRVDARYIYTNRFRPSAAVIAGIVISGIVFLLLLTWLFVWLCYWRRRGVYDDDVVYVDGGMTTVITPGSQVVYAGGAGQPYGQPVVYAGQQGPVYAGQQQGLPVYAAQGAPGAAPPVYGAQPVGSTVVYK
ncbi:hypothetical protein HDU96_009340 [Phlyctochytrium bullatum]|nr:hypothetical protein HDU96_009340 [Phlyctochytrium bullatum]